MFDKSGPDSFLRAVVIPATLFALLYLAYSFGHFIGEKDGMRAGLSASPAHQARLVAEAEARKQKYQKQEAEALLNSKQINVCDTAAKEAWYQDVADRVCWEYCADMSDHEGSPASDYSRW